MVRLRQRQKALKNNLFIVCNGQLYVNRACNSGHWTRQDDWQHEITAELHTTV